MSPVGDRFADQDRRQKTIAVFHDTNAVCPNRKADSGMGGIFIGYASFIRKNGVTLATHSGSSVGFFESDRARRGGVHPKFNREIIRDIREVAPMNSEDIILAIQLQGGVQNIPCCQVSVVGRKAPFKKRISRGSGN